LGFEKLAAKCKEIYPEANLTSSLRTAFHRELAKVKV
jgi:hypothetical protein